MGESCSVCRGKSGNQPEKTIIESKALLPRHVDSARHPVPDKIPLESVRRKQEKDGALDNASSPQGSPRTRSKKKNERFCAEELEELFHKVDSDHNGSVDVTELSMLFRLLGMAYTTKSIRDLLALIDKDHGGNISLPEFVSFFSSAKKSSDLSEVVARALREQAKSSCDDHSKTDVFIIHAMEPDSGFRRCYWLADLLENEGLTCAGPFQAARMQLKDPTHTRANDKAASFTYDLQLQSAGVDVRSLSECRSLVLLLDDQSLVGKVETDYLDNAGDLGLPVMCFYEHEPGYREDLDAWKLACPLVLANVQARPISRYFPRDSGEFCMMHIMQTLKRTRERKMMSSETDGDVLVEFGNFECLGEIPNVRWLSPEFAMVIDQNIAKYDLPETAFSKPGRARPFYVSYPRVESEKPGLSAKQFAKLRIVLHGSRIDDRALFYDAVSLIGSHEQGTSGSLMDMLSEGKKGVLNIMLLSTYIILDEVEPDCEKPEAYLCRGLCFLEAILGILTGNLLPTRPLQLEYFDQVIGREVSSGNETLREVLHANARSPAAITNRITNVLKKKRFSCGEERDSCLAILSEVLQRHPFLVEGSDGPALPAPPPMQHAASHREKGSKPMRRKLSFEGLKNVVGIQSTESSSPKRTQSEKLPRKRRPSAVQVVSSMLKTGKKRVPVMS